MDESLGVYMANFDRYRSAIENLLESTIDLTTLAQEAITVLLDQDLFCAARYLAGPPISEGDLKILANASLSTTEIRRNPQNAQAIIETILLGLDRERFPWLAENREPTEAERRTAVIASAALIASQRVRTNRQTESSARQQGMVRASLTSVDFVEDRPKAIPNHSVAPEVGHFCGECMLGTRKADFVVRLWDGRILAMECKVSNTELNSIKRLTNDAALKARIWIDDFGRANIVPSAMLAGAFGLRQLKDSQDRGLTIFWSHSLGELLAFIEATRPNPR
ncbi:MAG: XamI family restriction endonuclease [Dehalococcoidia bacterium]